MAAFTRSVSLFITAVSQPDATTSAQAQIRLNIQHSHSPVVYLRTDSSSGMTSASFLIAHQARSSIHPGQQPDLAGSRSRTTELCEGSVRRRAIRPCGTSS